MGRPLKTTKAQAVITVTNTTTTTNIITTSANFDNLGIIAGMPFIVATNIGGLVAGTMYWILSVVNSGNNSTFTASATPLNANPTYTPVTLSTASGSISTTIAPVDGLFNNPVQGDGYPAINTATYGVVGGNTAIYGRQVVANVAIGVSGAGNIWAESTGTRVGGIGTDFANSGGAPNTVIQYIAADGTPTTLGYVSSNAQPNIQLSAATATGNFLTSVGNAQTLTANLPVTFSVNIGGLTTGTTYFVRNIVNTAAFTVSATVGGANVALSNQSITSFARQDTVTLATNATATIANAPYIFATPEAGFIVRQKGKQKYLVTGTTSGRTGACFTANVANTAMLPNTMTITATYANATTQTVQSLSDHTGKLFTANSSPTATANIVTAAQPTGTLGYIDSAPAFVTYNTAVTTVAATALVAGTTYVISVVGTTNWTLVGAPSNFAVGTVFTATGAGTGTGTATIGGVPYPIVQIANT